MNGRVVMEVYDGQLSIMKRDGQSIGICVTRTEGSVTDEWGWKSPETYRSDIYDVTGKFRFSVPLSYVSAEGDYLIGYDPKVGSIRAYDRSDGKLLYDNVQNHFPLGDAYVMQLPSGTFIFHDDGTRITLPEEYLVRYGFSEEYIIVGKNGLQGLLNSNAEEVLPCRYTWLTTGDNGYVYVQEEGSDHQVIDPQTGETIFRWPYSISSMPTKDCAVVAVDDDYSGYQLVDLSGQPIISEEFSWINCYRVSEGSDPILQAIAEDRDSPVLFRPDGTILYAGEGSGYCTVLNEQMAMTCQYGTDSNSWYLLDLESGSKTELPNQGDSYYSQLYGVDGAEGYLLRGYTNEQGWYRHDILDAKGNMILSDLQDCAYLGNGIVQCRQGFRSGLLHLDGTWLYQEGTFSAMDDG